MKTTVFALLLSVAVMMTVAACANSNASATGDAEASTGVAIDENYKYPLDENLLSDDAQCIETLSDSVDYLVLPDDFARTAEIDSLVELYNICAATNALQSDFYIRTRDLLPAENLNAFDRSGVTDNTMLQPLNRLSTAIRSPYTEADEEEYWDKVGECFDALNQANQDNYFDAFMSKVDERVVDFFISDDRYVADIERLYASIKTDSTIVQQLRRRLVSEKQFIPQTVLARMYALACYAHDDSINTPEVATGVIESLLKSGAYSPYLPELWRMWRCRIQIDALSISNFGVIQNHLYNAMRNLVATTLLREYSQRHSSHALYAFLCLATEYNIIRTGSIIGNHATIEDMSLFFSSIHE